MSGDKTHSIPEYLDPNMAAKQEVQKELDSLSSMVHDPLGTMGVKLDSQSVAGKDSENLFPYKTPEDKASAQEHLKQLEKEGRLPDSKKYEIKKNPDPVKPGQALMHLKGKVRTSPATQGAIEFLSFFQEINPASADFTIPGAAEKIFQSIQKNEKWLSDIKKIVKVDQGNKEGAAIKDQISGFFTNTPEEFSFVSYLDLSEQDIIAIENDPQNLKQKIEDFLAKSEIAQMNAQERALFFGPKDITKNWEFFKEDFENLPEWARGGDFEDQYANYRKHGGNGSFEFWVNNVRKPEGGLAGFFGSPAMAKLMHLFGKFMKGGFFPGSEWESPKSKYVETHSQSLKEVKASEIKEGISEDIDTEDKPIVITDSDGNQIEDISSDFQSKYHNFIKYNPNADGLFKQGLKQIDLEFLIDNFSKLQEQGVIDLNENGISLNPIGIGWRPWNKESALLNPKSFAYSDITVENVVVKKDFSGFGDRFQLIREYFDEKENSSKTE